MPKNEAIHADIESSPEQDQQALAEFRELWGRMYRAGKAIHGFLVKTGHAKSLMDIRDRSHDGGPEYIALANNLAEALDAQHANFAELAEVSGRLAKILHHSTSLLVASTGVTSEESSLPIGSMN